MTVVECPQEQAWRQGEADTVVLMGAINLAMAKLVSTIRMLIDTDGWHLEGRRVSRARREPGPDRPADR